MLATPPMQRFCFAEEGAFVVPAEALGEEGMHAAWAACLLTKGRLTAPQLRCLERGFSLCWQRCRDLFAQAPASWFPPRQVNLLLVADASTVPPYFDPFGGTTSMLYVSDLDTDAEYVAFLLIHNERVSLQRSMRAALICNLSYWLGRDEASLLAFSEAARRARRPDARVFTRLADAFDWIRTLCHDPLRPPADNAASSYLRVDGADLFVPKPLQWPLMRLCDDAEAALRGAMQASTPVRRAGSAGSLDRLCDWLLRARAHAIVTSASGETVWAPGASDTRPLRSALRDATEDGLASLHRDLRVVHKRSRTFLDALHDPAALPRHCAVLQAGDGAYLDAARQAVVYELKQPGFDAITTAAPPCHRLLLGARVMHEWGHLAHAGKLVRVPEENKGRYRQARAELGDHFMQVLIRVPQRLQVDVARELQALAARPGDWPAALARKTLARVGDYLANLLCSRLLPPEELQAYVRANVRHHLAENLGLIGELARYAYEVHYLALAGMPRSYFFRTSRFGAYFIDSGLVTEADTQALFDAAGRVLACYAIDESKLALPAP